VLVELLVIASKTCTRCYSISKNRRHALIMPSKQNSSLIPSTFSFFSLRKIFFRELFFTRILKQQTTTGKKFI
jgi:hypothetical protein